MQEAPLCPAEMKDREKLCVVCSLQILLTMKHTCEINSGGICAVGRQVVEGLTVRARCCQHKSLQGECFQHKAFWPLSKVPPYSITKRTPDQVTLLKGQPSCGPKDGVTARPYYSSHLEAKLLPK